MLCNMARWLRNNPSVLFIFMKEEKGKWRYEGIGR